MQNSSAFQYLALDLIDESTTNPRQTFDESKLAELAASIREHGVIQPIVVRPKGNRFELVAGAHRFRGSLLAEQFTIPVHIKELTDTQTIEWQVVENAQRVDVHPYEEARGFDRLLDVPGYDVSAVAAKTGKSESHVYARLSLLKLIPEVAQAFVEERITASHANAIARLPEEHQADAFHNCWRKDWQDNEAHLLPVRHLDAWIADNLFLDLADAPFDREDIALNVEAGACLTCPKRSGYNTSLFADVSGDQCLDSACYQSKVTAHIAAVLVDRPGLVQIETSLRPPQQQKPGALNKNAYRMLDLPDNPDADLPCNTTRTALIVYGRGIGNTVMVCTDNQCPVHDPTTAARIAKEHAEHPAPVAAPAVDDETDEERQAREEENERRWLAYDAEAERRRVEREDAFEREQKEYEAEAKRREEAYHARVATLERIVEHAPLVFTPDQLRLVIQILLNDAPYGLFEEAAGHYMPDGENHGRTDDEVLTEALIVCVDEKLPAFLLRLLLTEHRAFPLGEQTDWLEKAGALFAPMSEKPRRSSKKREKGSKKLTASPLRKPAFDQAA
ncbi:ParB/RepB/Spo0J family partition protein [Terriglobus sp. TAA 43]|uniref:ParB/RepB/Spo0J family partition protein n=1 Tax=Terriglobus sp. TAA 43 TaxID=278961 RepID=UPI000691A900|nr:ParB/RepB/Spo0J family partition protein [Terriglobus sp. TAA 43]